MIEFVAKCGARFIVDDADAELVRGYVWYLDGKKAPHKYVARRARVGGINGRLYLHRLIMGAVRGQSVDHINGNPLDNRRCNLRFATPSQQQANRRKPQFPSGPSSSRYKGVTWNKASRRWQVIIKKNGVQHYAGVFTSEEEAARAYDRKARELFGAFARPNFPEMDAGGAAA